MTLYLSILTQILITVVAVCGVYVLTGLTGMFSLGQAAFMAVGSYASGILVVKCGFPFWLACILAVLIAVVIGYLVGFPTVRLRRDYISLVTLGFGEAITALLNRATKLTGGASGFIGIPRKTTFLLALVSAIAAIAIVSWFKTSKYGRQCIAVRGDELAAKAMGINVPKCVLHYLCGPDHFRLEKERGLGHHGVLRRRQQPDGFCCGCVHPQRSARGASFARPVPQHHLRNFGSAHHQL